MRYSKEDVSFHRIGYGGPGLPAVNVKVRVNFSHIDFPLVLGYVSQDDGPGVAVLTEPEFTYEWLTELDDDIVEGAFTVACEDGWEMLHELAAEILGPRVKVWSEGRSGGWCVAEGLPDFDSWNAIDLTRWRRFEVAAEAVVSGISRAMAELLYANVWLTRDVDPLRDLLVDVLDASQPFAANLTALADEIADALRGAGMVRPLPGLPAVA